MVSLTVTADDQQGICKYSAMMLEHSELTKALQKLSKSVENLDDSSTDMDLVLEEDEPVRVRCGTGFAAIPLEDAKERIEADLRGKRADLAALAGKKDQLEVQMAALRRTLYGKFGDALKLEL